MSKHTPAHGHTNVESKRSSLQNMCFACGKDNADGMQLEFFFDVDAHKAVCEFNLSVRYQGPPGHAHGGIIATILDEAMGKVNKLRNVLALTKSMNVEYKKPVPLNHVLTVTGREQQVNGREHTNIAEITNDKGEVLARSVGVFVAVDISRKFPSFMQVDS
jgi:uncharacterized protein (TIGR00369 family)